MEHAPWLLCHHLVVHTRVQLLHDEQELFLGQRPIATLPPHGGHPLSGTHCIALSGCAEQVARASSALPHQQRAYPSTHPMPLHHAACFCVPHCAPSLHCHASSSFPKSSRAIVSRLSTIALTGTMDTGVAMSTKSIGMVCHNHGMSSGDLSGRGHGGGASAASSTDGASTPTPTDGASTPTSTDGASTSATTSSFRLQAHSLG